MYLNIQKMLQTEEKFNLTLNHPDTEYIVEI